MKTIPDKLARLRKPGTSPRVLDLFSGCGGFSLGFQRQGCTIIGGVELDGHAATSHATNFHGDLERSDPALFKQHASSRDITKLDPVALLKDLGHSPDAVDLLIGGPPCPAFARVGRAKLGEIHKNPMAFKEDPRAKLYEPYLKFVEALQPVALVMENVPDILNFGGHNLGEEICEVLEELGYRCAYTLLNAANYGVPQMRERFFLIGLHRAVGGRPGFPAPTCFVDFPDGYQGARDVALKHTDLNGLFSRFVQTPPPSALNRDNHPAITISDAIGDLPAITGHLTGEITRGGRRLDEGVQLNLSFPRSRYIETLQSWPVFGVNSRPGEVTGHVIRSLSFRDYRIFRAMKSGEEYPAAYQYAMRFFHERCRLLRDMGLIFPEEQPIADELHAHLVTMLAMLRTTREDPEEGVSAALLHWSRGLPLFRKMDRAWWRYIGQTDVIRHQMLQSSAWSGLPDERELSRSFQSDWKTVEAWLKRLLSHNPLPPPDDPRQLDKLMQRLNRMLRYRRKKEAYQQTLDDLGITDTPQPLDRELEGDHPSSELKVTLKTLSQRLHANLKKDPPQPIQEREQLILLELLIIRISQNINAFYELKADFVPPYDPMKFPNKWRKMEPDKPSRTLLAHLGKDSYTHIHYDNAQARTLSVREAARLQSFPDGFQFSGSMNAGFRQIGNAVPPLMAAALAGEVLGRITGLPASMDLSASTESAAAAGDAGSPEPAQLATQPDALPQALQCPGSPEGIST